MAVAHWPARIAIRLIAAQPTSILGVNWRAAMPGSRHAETWTTAEAAFIVEKPLDIFQKVVERAPVKPRTVQRGGRRVRAFDLRDLVFFSALDALKRDLTPAKQGEVYRALARIEPDASMREVAVGQLTYDLDPYLRATLSKIAAARTLLGLIDTSGRDPLIAGTSIEAHRIAALLAGMTVAEILQDYPSLNERQILAAKVYAESHPKPGRPFPKVTAKKAMRETRADANEFLPARR